LAIVRRARETAPPERLWVAGMAAAATTVLAQCLTDWLWLLPGLLGLSVLALGLAAAGEDERREPSRARWSAGRIVAIALLGATLVSVAFLFLSDFYVRKARVESLRSPQAELSAARTAAWLDPVAVTPLYLQASALESEGRRAEARGKLEDALEREPENFVTLGLIGDFEVRGGKDDVARRYYRRALALNPLDIGLRQLSKGAE
jgi:tetratricopeptide (TPR) repeat protein